MNSMMVFLFPGDFLLLGLIVLVAVIAGGWIYFKDLFRKELPTVPEEVIQDTMRMIRRNITIENRDRLKQAFERLTPHATRIVMERLDKVERRQLVNLLGKTMKGGV